MFVHVVHQTWFRKSVSMLKTTHIPTRNEKHTAQNLHLLMMKNGFVTLV